MVLVSFIIVNYNTKVLLDDCLASIYRHTQEFKFEVIVIDNNSSDDSAQMVEEKYKEVVLIKSPENVGFGPANNIGINESKGKYLFFLNSDTIILNDVLKFFVEFIELADEKIGCLGAVLRDRDQKINGYGGEFPNFSNHLKKYVNRFFKKSEPFLESGESFDVDYVLGADMFIPRKVLENIGFFDTRYFMYYEESDLQLRMSNSGFARKIISGPKIIHFEGKSSSPSVSKMKIVQRSSHLYFKKNRPFFEYCLIRTLGMFSCFAMLFKRGYTFSESWDMFKFNFKK